MLRYFAPIAPAKPPKPAAESAPEPVTATKPRPSKKEPLQGGAGSVVDSAPKPKRAKRKDTIDEVVATEEDLNTSRGSRKRVCAQVALAAVRHEQ